MDMVPLYVCFQRLFKIRKKNYRAISTCTIFSSPVGSLCHTRGVVRRPAFVVRRVSSVSTITTRNN